MKQEPVDFKKILSSDLPKDVIIDHPTLTINGRPYQHISVQYAEDKLNELFGLYTTYIKECTVANGFVTIIKKVEVNNSDGYAVSHDGIGVVEINELNPLPLATSIANSLALKNAAENFGKAFGRDLNRGFDVVVIQKEKVKPKPDMIVMQKYANALASKDNVSVMEIEANYDMSKFKPKQPRPKRAAPKKLNLKKGSLT